MPDSLVSICLPTRNRAARLRNSLATIRAQEYTSFEVIISDNCSDDDTEQVCREVTAVDPRFRYVRQPHNIGIHGNHNFTMDAARGEFVCILHDHDVRDPQMLREYMEFMRAHPRVGVVCADWDLVGDDEKSLGLRPFDGSVITPGYDYIAQTIRAGRSSLGTPGALVRREALGSARFGVDAPIGFGDFPIWFHVAESWDIGHIHTRRWSWRQNAESHSARPIVSIARDYEKNLGGYCDDHLRRRPEHAALVAQWRTSISRYLFWALAYEVGLYFRTRRAPKPGQTPRTLFEIMDYRLTPDQFDGVLRQLRSHRATSAEYVAFAAIQTLIRLRMTSPLGWAVRHQADARSLLGLN